MDQSSIVKSFNLAAAGKAWYPTPSADLTGTLTAESTSRTVRGTGTSFKTQLSEGDYLLNPSNDELSIIDRIESDTLLYVKTTFPSGLAGVTCKRIKNKHLKGLQIVFAGSNVGTIRGASQTAGGTWPVGAVWRHNNLNGGIEPQLVTVGASSTGHITTIE